MKDRSTSSKINIYRYENGEITPTSDFIAIEDPLQLNIAFGKGEHRTKKKLAITMRTPGNDFDLAKGFLFTEGIIQDVKEIMVIKNIRENHVLIEIDPEVEVNALKLERNFYMTSSCGVCGKASIDQVQTNSSFISPQDFEISINNILSLPQTLRKQQLNFQRSGGLHAAALFNFNGVFLNLREDVGRHNAADKLIGAYLKDHSEDLQNGILLLSGRGSFELIQKAAMANIPVVACIGAPSSLAIELADAHRMTLIGFLSHERCNIYTGQQIIV